MCWDVAVKQKGLLTSGKLSGLWCAKNTLRYKSGLGLSEHGPETEELRRGCGPGEMAQLLEAHNQIRKRRSCGQRESVMRQRNNKLLRAWGLGIKFQTRIQELERGTEDGPRGIMAALGMCGRRNRRGPVLPYQRFTHYSERNGNPLAVPKTVTFMTFKSEFSWQLHHCQ